MTEVERAHWRQPFSIATSLCAERFVDYTLCLIEAVAAGKRSYVSRGCGKTGQRKWEEGARLWRSISLEELYYACSQRPDVRERSLPGRRKKYLHVCALVFIAVILLADRADRSWRADRKLVRSSEVGVKPHDLSSKL